MLHGCGGGGSESSPSSAAPTVRISASQPQVSRGKSITLTWTTTKADACTATGQWAGGKAATGSESVIVTADSQTYAMRCTGPGGTAESSVKVTGSNDPPVSAFAFPLQQSREGDAFRWVVPAGAFADPNGDPLTLVLTREDGSALPAWLRFEAPTLTLAGTPDWADAGDLKLRVTATDTRDASVSIPLLIAVRSTSVIPVDLTGRLAFAGSWQPIASEFFRTDYNPLAVVNSYAVFPFGLAKRHGLALSGWSYAGFDWEGSPQQAGTTPVDAVLLEQNAAGHLRIATRDYVADPRTNGGQSVFTSDVNSDGTLDVILLAHNESPFIAKPSTVLVSNGPGSYANVKLDDAVMAHDAQLVSVGGRDVLYTMSFLTSNSYPGLPRGLFNPRYEWTSSGRFSWRENFYAGGGMSITAGDLRGDGTTWLAIGDNVSGGYVDESSRDNTFFRIAIFDERNPDVPLTRLMPYFSARTAYEQSKSLWGRWVTHIPRLWTDDFNHDGHVDLLASTSMWPQNLSMLQMLQNAGDGVDFSDRTDELNPEYEAVDGEVDYSMQRVDIDGSGIETYFLANAGAQQTWKRRNYVLLNDGTGRLYPVLQPQFDGWCQQALAFVDSTKGPVNGTRQCQMMGYPNEAGRYNFVAMIDNRCRNESGDYGCFSFVSIDTDLDLVKAYKKPVRVTDRNGSKRIRTFGGDDTITRKEGDPDASIDGGAGLDVAVYPQTFAAYGVVRRNGVVEIEPLVGGPNDVLKNVEFARFSDRTVDLRSF
jgi:hypothetical protein